MGRRIFLRYAENDLDVLRLAQSMEDYGATVISVSLSSNSKYCVVAALPGLLSVDEFNAAVREIDRKISEAKPVSNDTDMGADLAAPLRAERERTAAIVAAAKAYVAAHVASETAERAYILEARRYNSLADDRVEQGLLLNAAFGKTMNCHRAENAARDVLAALVEASR